jgi:lipopolysaccharide/colanic/teichoic acid biosynthesis glycosyltransferase
MFYRQERVGQHGRPFQIIKLRTMVDGADQQGSKLTHSGDRRITRVGSFLRKTKLDEIPQLLNVLRGEMSLVGPRPEVPEYVAMYTLTQKQLLDLKPGLTGPASIAFIDEGQVLAAEPDKENFYLNVVLPAKLERDLAYCTSISFFGDIKLILLTVARTLLQKRDHGQSRASLFVPLSSRSATAQGAYTAAVRPSPSSEARASTAIGRAVVTGENR